MQRKQRKTKQDVYKRGRQIPIYRIAKEVQDEQF